MKTYCRIVVVVTLLVIFNNVNGQSKGIDSTKVKVDKDYIFGFGRDIKPLVISPARWTKREWIGTAGVLGSSIFLYSKDKEIAEFWINNQSPAIDNANKYFFEPFGKMYYTIPLMGGFYIYGAFAGKNKPKRVAMDFVQASFYSGVIVTAIKHLTHRHRPYQTDPLNPYLWDGPKTDNWYRTSFPSGHTIMAFTFASVVGTHYKDKTWVPITVYTLAVLEGASRMYSNKHWCTDVVIGGALGYAIGKFVVNHNKSKIQTVPIISSTFTGMHLTYSL